jgi:hypothetical protein
MLEVLIGLVLAMVGLLGTLAVQQAVLSATVVTQDANTALRLASAAVEEVNTRRTMGPTMDDIAPIATGAWTNTVWLDASGTVSGSQTAAARFGRRIRVENRGSGQPYVISVEVSYNMDTGAPKTVRLDFERRKIW